MVPEGSDVLPFTTGKYVCPRITTHGVKLKKWNIFLNVREIAYIRICKFFMTCFPLFCYSCVTLCSLMACLSLWVEDKAQSLFVLSSQRSYDCHRCVRNSRLTCCSVCFMYFLGNVIFAKRPFDQCMTVVSKVPYCFSPGVFSFWIVFLMDVCALSPLPSWQSFPYKRTHLSKVDSPSYLLTSD